MDVSIIIVNYNTKDLTQNCINSIFEKTKEVEFEVIVVDNASIDGSVEYLSREKRIKLIRSTENLGFGKANNLGFKYASGKYIFLLNSDTILLNNAVKIFFDFFEANQNKSIACLGGYLLNENKEIIHSFAKFPNFVYLIKNALNHYFIFLGIDLLKKYYCNYDKKNIKTKIVDYIIGADLFIDRRVINLEGFFDEQFFLYYEETDLQKRYSNLGYSSVIIEGPEIIHLCGGSDKRKKKSILYMIIPLRSCFQYTKKHFSLYIYYIIRLFYLIVLSPKVIIYKDNLRNKLKLMRFLITNKP